MNKKLTVVKSLTILFKLVPFLCTILIVLTLLASLIPLGQLFIINNITNNITLIFSGNNDNLYVTIMLVVLQAFLSIISYAISTLSRMVNLKVQNKIVFYFDNEVIKKSLKVKYELFESNDFYNKMQMATNGSAQRICTLYGSLLILLQDFVTICSFFFYLIAKSWVLTICVLFPIIIYFVINSKISRIRHKQILEHSQSNRELFYYYRLFSSKDSAREFRIFRHYDYVRDKRNGVFWKNTSELFKVEKIYSKVSLLPIIISSLTTLLASIILIFIGKTGRLTLGDFVSIIQLLNNSQSSGHRISTTLSSVVEDLLFINNLFDFLSLPEVNNYGKDKFPSKLSYGITINNLSYAYPNSNKLILENISFHIKPGEKIVIVGENGAGKSSLVKCMLGLLEPTGGEILYDNIGIDNYDRESFYNNTSVLFQDFIKYQMTLRENVGFGDISKIERDDQLFKALIQSGYNIEDLSKLDDSLGSEFHGGYDLSGGQWQKIALSRAFLRESQVIVLDEPTASLDPIAEYNLFRQFLDLVEGKTAIYISHRLRICVEADRILVLQNGKLIEQGTHKDLLSSNGVYAQMYNSQSEIYSVT